MKEILVTGGAGYLGSQLVEKLLEQNYKVRILDDLSFGNNALKILKKKKYFFNLIRGDIRDLRTVLKSMEGVDAVVHLAGIVGDPASKLDPIQSTEINYLSTKIVSDVAKYFKIKKFLFASSCSVYGASNGILDENSKLRPLSLYAETKLKSEKILLEQKGKNFNPTILRAGTLFGYSNRMRFDLVINFFVAQAIFNHKIYIEGGYQWRPFLHVEDAADAYILALEQKSSKSNGIFNLGADELNYQISQVGKLVEESIPNVELKFMRKNDQRNYRVSFKKIRKTLGFEYKKSIKDGIEEIKKAIKLKKIRNWTDPIYYNNRFPLVGKNKSSKYYWQ